MQRAHALEEMGYGPQALEQYLGAAQLLGPLLDSFLRAGQWYGLCQKLQARAAARG